MNCVPLAAGALAAPFAAWVAFAGVVLETALAPPAAAPPAGFVDADPVDGDVIPPVNPSFCAALSFGVAPKPHPPSLWRATIAPAHFPAAIN